MKIYFETYGCAANQADELVMRSILKNDFEFTKNIEDSHIIIMLTCGVKGSTENKIIQRIKHIRKTYPNKKVILAGCLTKIIPKKLQKMFPDYSLIGPDQVSDILKIVKKVAKGERVIDIRTYSSDTSLSSKRVCIVPTVVKEAQPIAIASGCLNACAYCATKIAKGNLKSLPIECVVRSVKYAVEHGAKKILLTATDCGAYGKDIGTNIVELLKEVVKIPGDFKIRVGMMNPQYVKEFVDDLIEVYKNPKIIKFLHIPVQSGSNKVLKDMRRGYTVEEFKGIVKRFRKEIPDIRISTDIICGYPTETKEDFRKTIKLIKEIKPEVLNISKFYPREGTYAKTLKQLPTKEIKERSRKLTEFYKKLKKDLIKNKD
ncbi:MAG: tRNA (N(6)-L-threonylcarbamoyladenosine(37)-C(2))-methylthiotransferase [Nanoarchaeota archaeon]|nr:tRNA (N(6)-L-threonylcarbamoyladenosine(37)-C(2))-methylthiotransferase [Nanoarchaeota archaeon]